MKQVKNNSRQAITVFFKTDTGCSEKTIRPGDSVVVPENFITEQIKTLQRRRVFKISNA